MTTLTLPCSHLHFLYFFLSTVSDVTSRNQIYPVSLANSNWHLLKYYYFDSLSDCFVYPFASHERWMHWGQKTAERHRLNSQKNIYTQHHPEDVSNPTSNPTSIPILNQTFH